MGPGGLWEEVWQQAVGRKEEFFRHGPEVRALLGLEEEAKITWRGGRGNTQVIQVGCLEFNIPQTCDNLEKPLRTSPPSSHFSSVSRACQSPPLVKPICGSQDAE